ncbi:endonuclease/exonuclease/phosphatase family protein [Plantactinospora sp. BC1]|uniref:endonuclease/exonuclease/phosphatase family protein n=1 Tax=Plantactinospora sp. BC1 TaxID=2108470 RepID=UPI001F461566|nr:endonuclease/exonuclease/phosphatase family protein [Plantactinospora sp. BC1]
MRFRRGLATFAAAVLAMVPAVVLSAAAPASAGEVNASYNVWTWNVAGWKMHRGATGNGLITVLANSIRNRKADFAALNELCWSQYKAVQSNLRASGWPAAVENFSRFQEHNSTHCNGEPFGLAIFSRQPMGPADRFPLAPDGSSERRQLLCAPLEARPHLRFCTTHITPSNDVIGGLKINERQLGEVLTVVENYHAAGDTVIIAGDFNAQPDYGRMNPWYSRNLDVPLNGGNRGDYRELDDTHADSPGYGETTVADGDTSGPDGQGKKIDMIFVREDRIVGAYTGDSLSISTACGGACSDHRILIGTVTVRVTT